MTQSRLPSRGRPGLTLMMITERQLTVNDLFEIQLTDDDNRIASPVLKRLRASHHTAARLIAEGRTAIEVAHIVNRTPQNIRDLARNDPAFRDLVSYYHNQLEDVGMEDSKRIQSKLRLLAEAATDELLERFDDDGKRAAMSTDVVNRVAQMGLDRTDAPPKTAQPIVSTPTRITFNIGTKNIKPPDEVDSKIVEHNDDQD